MSNPLVSVCVASYNNAHFIIETLDSIENQTYSNIELIIVDDYSKDNSVDVVNQWLKKTKLPFKFIINEVNLGVCKSVNIMIANSSGKYLSTIASDDLMLPEKIATQVEILEKSSENVGLVYSDAYLIGPKSEPYFGRFIQRHSPRILEVPEGDILGDLMHDNFIPVMSILWKKKCFEICGGFDENLFYEDYDMLIRLASKFEFVFSSFISVKYRLHSNNLHKRMQNAVTAESDFNIFFKHIGVRNGIYDEAIQVKLKDALLRMYDYKSSKINHYFKQYYEVYKKDDVLKFAISSGLPYYRLLQMHRLITKIKG